MPVERSIPKPQAPQRGQGKDIGRRGGYPAKLKKVLIVTAPLWFKAPQLGGQLQVDHAAWLEHCRNCYNNALNSAKLEGDDEYVIANHIPPVKQNGIIPGAGSCDMSTGVSPDMHISDPPYTCDPSPLRHTRGFNGDMKGRHINSGDEDDLDISTRGTWSSGEASPGLSDEECGGGGAGITPAALLARVRALGRRGLVAEYEELRARPPTGTFHHARLPSNLAKNRYTDVLCYDHTRVVLSQTDPDDPTSDYINANYVDGYKQKNAYICTQGEWLLRPVLRYLLRLLLRPHARSSLADRPRRPDVGLHQRELRRRIQTEERIHLYSGSTAKDVRRLLAHGVGAERAGDRDDHARRRARPLVMTTRAVERGRVKCGQYWPLTVTTLYYTYQTLVAPHIVVWEQNALVIVMTTRAVERGRVKCGQYWPLTVTTLYYTYQTLVAPHIVVWEQNALVIVMTTRAVERGRVKCGQYWPLTVTTLYYTYQTLVAPHIVVWEQNALVIVMTTRAVERGRVKCGQYWPLTVKARAVHGGFAVTTEAIETEDDYTITHLLLTDLRTEQSRRIWHGQYTRWPDYGVPGGGRATPVLRFLALVRRAQQHQLQDLGDAWAGHSKGPPIVVHCSAGIGRTGTFLTLDISANRLAAEGVVDVRGTVERVREQRAHSIQMPDQYVFCHLAVLEHAVNSGYLESADLTGFDADNDDESE
ncbi:protein-tyrosine phosphatase domain-containing protein [Phthorimaea operculella]|nr:protein-tyrosine phosphatase domain-containing protein [Phthorimaea operculella]